MGLGVRRASRLCVIHKDTPRLAGIESARLPNIFRQANLLLRVTK